MEKYQIRGDYDDTWSKYVDQLDEGALNNMKIVLKRNFGVEIFSVISKGIFRVFIIINLLI